MRTFCTFCNPVRVSVTLRNPVQRITPRRWTSSTVAHLAKVNPGPVLSQTNRAEITLRRFWKTVNIHSEPNGHYLIALDHRHLKTPAGTKLVIPKERRLLAVLIANEWENQDEVLKQHALPVTSLASRAIDGLRDDKIRVEVIEALMKYLETDTVLFPQDEPPALVRMQQEHWQPLFDWLRNELGVHVQATEGLIPARQSDETLARLRRIVEEMDTWELAAFERAAYASKSFIIALALCKGRLTADKAADASHVEVRSQIERWGEVEDTHDVDYQDIRRALGSAACMVSRS
ncbi:ATP synthase mitochondrial F1 complex assembly factor 2 [Tremella mesenterica]|uniref:ATP synthase mitochondrial F1 complex assembly factor 2 n=1 Tax=Tremella mesenterica TaxID=5217 RepID=A0A4Q1BUX5_TREME|nr:ATP synthase mitochondrial F1 complex assembly factor 2 [Tremella mesenterica]